MIIKYDICGSPRLEEIGNGLVRCYYCKAGFVPSSLEEKREKLPVPNLDGLPVLDTCDD